MDVGKVASTRALANAGIKLPRLKHIGKRRVTDFGMGMGFGASSNFGARTPIFTPIPQMSGVDGQLSQNFLTVMTTSLHTYTCFNASVGPKELKSEFAKHWQRKHVQWQAAVQHQHSTVRSCGTKTRKRQKIIKLLTTYAYSLVNAMPLHVDEGGSAVMVASKCGAKYMLNIPAKMDTRTLRNLCENAGRT